MTEPSTFGLLGTLIERLHALSDHYLAEAKRKPGGQQTREKSKREIYEQFAYELRDLESLALPPAPLQAQEPFRVALEQIVALDLKKDEHGKDDFYSGPGRFFRAHRIAREALAASSPTQAQEPANRHIQAFDVVQAWTQETHDGCEPCRECLAALHKAVAQGWHAEKEK